MSSFLRTLAIAGSWWLGIAGGMPSISVAEEKPAFAPSVESFLKKHCAECHGPKRHEAQLMLHKLSGDLDDDGSEVWTSVLEQLSLGQMPPEDAPQPSAEERSQVVGWIRTRLETAPARPRVYPADGNRLDHRLLFGDAAEIGLPAATSPRIWRLNPHSYREQISRVLVGNVPGSSQSYRMSRIVDPWGLSTDVGLKDFAALYRIDESETELLMGNAHAATLGSTSRFMSLTEFRQFLQPRADADTTDKQLQMVVDTAFRHVLNRTPNQEESVRYKKFLEESVEQFDRRRGLAMMLSAVLLHPEAVFRFELGGGTPDKHGRVMLQPRELARAIALAVTDQGPDEPLLQAAENGRLGTRDDVRREITRLLADEELPKPRLLRFFQEYFGYPEAVEVFKDEKTVRSGPVSGAYKPEYFVEDTDHLVLHILARDRNVLAELLTTRESFVGVSAIADWRKRQAEGKGTAHPFTGWNNRTNRYYNVAGEEWSDEQPLTLPEGERAGILTQPSWLIAHSTNFENHAILRGKWIREHLLGGSIPDTPITVDARLPEDPHLTLRERMQVTREAFCWKCHRQMDPLGLPFEMYDHFGLYRTTEFDRPVDTRGEIFASGDPALHGPVENAVELMHRLARSRHVEQVFVRHAFRYWLGRNETPADAKAIQEAHQAYVESGGSMKALVASLVTSDPFLYRKVRTGNTPSEPN